MIIAIDGPTGTGKTTVARALARKLSLPYFDTGAMYRSLTYALLKAKIDVNDETALKDFLKTFDFTFEGDRYFVKGEEVTAFIRQSQVTQAVSPISAIPLVREKLVSLQRQLGERGSAVFEGRDIGTVVFPKAEIKIFLTGRPEVKARRRFLEFKEKYPEKSQGLTLEKVLNDLEKRDALDSSRDLSPLCQAKDAICIDTSDLTIEEVVFKILEIVQEKGLA